MTDYKKAFKILVSKMELGQHIVAGKKQNIYMIGVNESDIAVTKEEYEFIKDCLEEIKQDARL